jgi:RNA polymerase sigma-70 factor (ECF subfamily)
VVRITAVASAITGDARMVNEHEQELISRIRTGDLAAFEQLYEEFGPGLIAFAYSHVRYRAIAEELVQELFLNLWKYRQKWVLSRSLTAYLYGALRNHIYSYRRTMAGRDELSRSSSNNDAGLAALPSASRTDDLVRESELQDAIDRAVESLSPRCQETFVLVHERHLSYAEAAEVMGVSIKAIEMNIVRAFAALRRDLADWRD